MINIEEKITRKSNLEQNDSISCYMHHCAQQTHNVYPLFYSFLQEIKPARILEIGTAAGGLTLFLAEMCKGLNLPTKITTYDIRRPQWSYDELLQNGIDVNIENVFLRDSNEKNVINPILEFIKQDGVSLVLCDGGNKINEFNILSNHIKPGDFIMAHDYAKDRQFFNEHINKKVWNWLEITFDDIKDSVTTNNLVKYEKVNFDMGVWACFQKVI